MYATPIAVVLLATGCQTVFGLDDPRLRDSGSEPKLCWSTDLQLCLPEPATDSIGLAGQLDTTDSPKCVSTITGYCVIAANRITINTFEVTGSRPLVLIANDTISIVETLDVASHVQPRKAGTALEGATCGPFSATPTTQGGGAGGTFAGAGGTGAGNNDSPPDSGGSPAAAGVVTGFRAGCPGQDGGGAGNGFGLGGLGGGVVLLTAGVRIDVRGRINASGAAGLGGACDAPCATNGPNAFGGGGGGSGGMILLEAPVIENTGLIYADGGGGGEGASRSQNGVPGTDPGGAGVARGGNGPATHGGNGGNGSHDQLRNGAVGFPGDSSNPGGGGGGGGGAGAIRVRGTTGITGIGMVSPVPVVL